MGSAAGLESLGSHAVRGQRPVLRARAAAVSAGDRRRAVREALALDGSGRLIDVGCGPGSLTLLLAPLFVGAVGVDPDPGMLAEAEAEAARRGVTGVRWVQMAAESLPGDLGSFRVATFAQSFHWMQRETVAAAVRAMLEPGGSWIHVSATTHQGADGEHDLDLALAAARRRSTT